MAGTGWLVGWRLTFGAEDLTWEGSLATIVEDPDSQVFVVFYDMMPEDEERLDSWEGSDLGLHKKIRLRVQTLEGSVLAWLYVLDAYEGGLPSARYLGVVADAAEAAGAPADYVGDLRPARVAESARSQVAIHRAPKLSTAPGEPMSVTARFEHAGPRDRHPGQHRHP